MFKIRTFIFIKTLFTRFSVGVGILLTCRTDLHDRIISLREEAWDHKSNLFHKRVVACAKFDIYVFISPATLYRSSCTKPRERPCICVLLISIWPLCTNFD